MSGASLGCADGCGAGGGSSEGFGVTPALASDAGIATGVPPAAASCSLAAAAFAAARSSVVSDRSLTALPAYGNADVRAPEIETRQQILCERIRRRVPGCRDGVVGECAEVAHVTA